MLLKSIRVHARASYEELSAPQHHIGALSVADAHAVGEDRSAAERWGGWGLGVRVRRRTYLDGRDPLAACLQQHADAARRDALPEPADHASRHEDVLHRGRSRLRGAVLWSRAFVFSAGINVRHSARASRLLLPLALLPRGSRSLNGSAAQQAAAGRQGLVLQHPSQTEELEIDGYNSRSNTAPCSNYRTVHFMHSNRWQWG